MLTFSGDNILEWRSRLSSRKNSLPQEITRGVSQIKFVAWGVIFCLCCVLVIIYLCKHLLLWKQYFEMEKQYTTMRAIITIIIIVWSAAGAVQGRIPTVLHQQFDNL